MLRKGFPFQIGSQKLICATKMFTIHLGSFSKKPQNHKIRKYSITSLQCIEGWRERFQVLFVLYLLSRIHIRKSIL